MKKQSRGTCEELVGQDGKLAIVKWFDLSIYSFPFMGHNPKVSVKDGVNLMVKQPDVLRQYNCRMVVIDLLDRVIAKYPMRYSMNKWSIKAIFYFFDFATAASWLEYREETKKHKVKKSCDYLDFKFLIANKLLD